MALSLKPQNPIIDWSKSLTKGLFIDCPFFEGSGAQTRNIVRRVDGSFTGTLPWNIGAYGRILRFSSTQGITLLDDSSHDLVSGFSMEALCKWDNTGVNNTIISKRSGYNATGIPFEVTRDGQTISLRVIGNSSNLTTGNIISSGVWYHVVCTWDGATQAIYVNGVLITSSARTGTVTNNATDVCIGMLPGGAEKMSGDLSHVRCWNRGLSVSEVDALYTDTWAVYKKPNIFQRAISEITQPSTMTGVNTMTGVQTVTI